MAGRDSHFAGTKTLPAMKVRRTDIRKTRKAMKYKAFAKPLTLPSIELMYADLNDVSSLFSKKQVCKKVSDWFTSWRPWQKRILLCKMTEKVSKSQLHSLITTLEPVFHRDFVLELRGSYPTIFLKPRFVHTISSLLGDTDLRTLRQDKGESIDAGDEKTKKSLGKQDLETLRRISEEHDELGDCYHEIAVEKGVEYEHVSEVDDVTLPSFAVTPAATVEIRPSRRHEHAPPFLRLRKVSTRNFFPDSKIPKLGTMKSVLRPEDKKVFGKDPVSFKYSKWWEGHEGPKLLNPRRSRLARFFKAQLNQINQWLDEWAPHERVDMLAEVVKCCDADCLNFFALCLSRRLKDQTGIDSIPDVLLRKVFSYLDIKSLCRSSQVCRRWRFLSQESGLWRRKVRILGFNEGIVNLPMKIITLGKGHLVDWKQAYQEVRTFYKQLESMETKEEVQETQEEVVVKKKPVQKSLDEKLIGTPSPDVVKPSIVKEVPKERAKPPAVASGLGLIDISVVQTLKDIGPAQSPATTDQRGHQDEFETKDEDKNDLTGGNLKMLAKSLRALMRERREPEDIALDVRPTLVQALNLLDAKRTPRSKFHYISLAVQGVLAVQRVKRLQGHMDGVLCLEFDLKRVITGSSDRTIRVWDVRSGRSIRKLKGHKGGVRCLQFDSKKILSGSWDMTIMVWDIVKFECLRVLYGHKGCVSCLKFDEHHIVSGSHDHTIRVWDINTWECIKVINAHDGVVMCLEFEGQYVLSGSLDKTLKLWDVETEEVLRVFTGHSDGVTSLIVVGGLMISGSADGMLFFWDVDTGHCEAAIQAHEGSVHSICASVTGEHFLSGGGDNLIKEWDTATCTCLRTLQGHRGAVLCVRTNPRRILSCSGDGTVRIWDLEKPNPEGQSRNISVQGNNVDPAMVRGAK
ncbi:probable E3 ubiquitin ligase complex SCF subunit sconB [Actinia tenebrosa]|uniref:Probable E3 ubiquitin ligase complex SCF subunit sconB n=1 Tax=Actinia tenebrosa TaxID=6105 RepID=A0A6P8IKB8_ACTTE|nr:probable E3 ubiquitin ligase complex SCF subunit sconB [Actinia tenebrosa]